MKQRLIDYAWCLLPMLLFSISTASNAEEIMADGQSRPTIAVVLAGGGAKGAAHIGVLKALEEMRIPVDIVTGTSMGSYVGGLYALGMDADEIEKTLYEIDWNSGYHDRVERSERRIRDKVYDDRYQLHTDLGLRWIGVQVPKGVVQGQNMLHILRQSTKNIPAFQSFDDLPIHYRAVATDILALKPVVLKDGEIVDAMMASMSVPGALPPYKYRGMLLVDGGVTNNMPVDIAREMGADIIIAVDISTDYLTGDQLTTFLTVGNQLSNYLVRRSTQEQSEKLHDTDVLLKPHVGNMSTTDFAEMPEALKQGYQVAEQNKKILQAYSIPELDYLAYQNKKNAIREKIHSGSDLQLAKVNIINNSHYNEKLLRHRLDIEAGETYTSDEIETKVRDLYALDRFERISYQYTETEDGKADLTIDVNEKEWGPNYLDFRFSLEDNFKNSSKYSIGLTSNFTDLTDDGAELRTNFEIGTDKLIVFELYVPMSYNQNFFTSFSGSYLDEKSSIFIPQNSLNSNSIDTSTSLSDTENSLPVDYIRWVGDIALGFQPTLWQEFRVGIRYTDGNTSITGLPAAGDFDYTRQGAYVRYRFDTLNDVNFPTKGYYADLQYLLSQDETEDSGNTSKDIVSEISAKLMVAEHYKKHSLVAQVEYETIDSRHAIVPIAPRELGGFLNLSGLPKDSLTGSNKAFSSLVYRYKWFENDFGLFQSPVYLGASLEYGGVWVDPNKKLDTDSMYFSGSLFTGIDSPVGPIMLAYGQTEQGFESVYLIVGSSF
nr:patatin-like phospholipase family protein [Vibrio algicola]